MATGHAHKRSNENKRKHGFTNRHKTKDSDYSPCVPTSNFPCTAPDQTSSAHWNLSTAPLCPAPPWPGLWVGGGIRSPWSATRGQLSFYPVPRGGSLSQEYPFTDANIILNVMWSSSVRQHCHTPTITPPTPPPPPPPALTHILNSKAEAITPIFTISSSLQNRPDKRDQKHGHAAKTHPQTSLWPDPQRKSKCKSHHPAPFFCPSVTQSTKPLIIQPLLHPPLTTPFQLLHPLSPLS